MTRLRLAALALCIAGGSGCSNLDHAKYHLTPEGTDQLGIRVVASSGSPNLSDIVQASLFPPNGTPLLGYAEVTVKPRPGFTTGTPAQTLLTIFSAMTLTTINLVGMPMSWATSEATVIVNLYDVAGKEVGTYEAKAKGTAHMGYFRYAENTCARASVAKAVQNTILDLRPRILADAPALTRALAAAGPNSAEALKTALAIHPEWESHYNLPEPMYTEVCEDKDYIATQTPFAVEAMEAYLSRHPQGRYREEVRAAHAQSLYYSACDSDRQAGYEEVLALYGGEEWPSVKACRERLAAIGIGAALVEACLAGNGESVEVALARGETLAESYEASREVWRLLVRANYQGTPTTKDGEHSTTGATTDQERAEILGKIELLLRAGADVDRYRITGYEPSGWRSLETEQKGEDGSFLRRTLISSTVGAEGRLVPPDAHGLTALEFARRYCLDAFAAALAADRTR